MWDIFTEPSQANLEKFEEGLSYNERRMLDLVHQTLNQVSNNVQDYKNISDLMNIYNKVLSNRTNDQFKASLELSRQCYKESSKLLTLIKSLKNDGSNSFIILPIASNDHQFGIIFRKQTDEFTATIINKGSRPYSSQFIEHKINTKHLETLIDGLQKANGKFPVYSIYNTLRMYSSKITNLNITSKNQKVGNCFIKEPENTIKFAFATRNFTKGDFEKLVDQKELFESKWDQLTDTVHQHFVSIIKSEYPKISKQVNYEYETYSKNKIFRDLIVEKPAKDFNKILFKAFDSEGRFSGLNQNDRIKKCLAYVNRDTLTNNEKELSYIVQSMNDPKYAKSYSISNGLLRGFVSTRMHYMPDTVLDSFSKAQNNFPILCKELKYEYSANMMILGLNNSELSGIVNNKFLDASIKLYPYNYHLYCFKGMYNLMEGKNDLYKESIDDLTKAIDLRPDYSNAIYLRGRAYQKLAMDKEAEADFAKAKEINPILVEKWKNLSEDTIYVDYFKEIVAKIQKTNSNETLPIEKIRNNSFIAKLATKINPEISKPEFSMVR